MSFFDKHYFSGSICLLFIFIGVYHYSVIYFATMIGSEDRIEFIKKIEEEKCSG